MIGIEIVIIMSQEYATIRLPKVIVDLVDKYIEENKDKLTIEGRRPSRASVVKMALHAFLKEEGIIKE